MNIAVIGANGYLGQHLVYYLLKEKQQKPDCYDIQPDFAGKDTVAYQQLNICDKEQIGNCFAAYDYIYFFSGLTGTDVSIDRYRSFIEVNELGLLNVLDSLKDLNTKPKLIFPSTRLVYKGQENTPLSEDAEKEFRTIYSSSKFNGEKYLEMFRNLYAQPYTVFRICVPYGNVVGGQLSYGTVSFFLNKATNGEAITLFGNGNLKRTFTHVMDLCRQIVEVSAKPESNGNCFNTAGETYSLKEVATMIGEKFLVPVQFSEWPKKAWKLESGDTIFESSKLEQLLPEALKFSIKEWINA
ncbi:SDR family oxidoreductase [Adhaeribacter sp. BT258]|uniref:SDR family oxidoreductase n=1 Tax=Adhaeribacter terrigena TaxID=2793070 RepID=A0ABS1BXT0_9BACT|nr:SDR family oxidoreductase [Adhaeribacter terrigena]MBK0401721.1 SDR family oxidoreductase [Adhaeribacter terrigena]